jgi:tryptophan-rich sensory protein
MEIKSKMDIFVLFIIAAKLMFSITWFLVIIFSKTGYDKILNDDFIYARDVSEFIFNFSMAIIFVVVFNPYYKYAGAIDKEMRLLFFVYGTILILTVDWPMIFGHLKIFDTLHKAFSP